MFVGFPFCFRWIFVGFLVGVGFGLDLFNRSAHSAGPGLFMQWCNGAMMQWLYDAMVLVHCCTDAMMQWCEGCIHKVLFHKNLFQMIQNNASHREWGALFRDNTQHLGK
jgi:hypothetical protein